MGCRCSRSAEGLGYQGSVPSLGWCRRDPGDVIYQDSGVSLSLGDDYAPLAGEDRPSAPIVSQPSDWTPPGMMRLPPVKNVSRQNGAVKYRENPY
ncbi:F-hypothetical UL11 protein [Chelonid alphaherpesvirus 5]|uniref:F-hypothetical UL11 protein n=1 Tax=Chelonid alphaherpesvirus 5 TaxID=702736 RepID=V5NWI1_9ALPH|nr:F-hypothetical UL11 protein [Chelonid alphaherpesvirus 5]AHA93331.1 F-hypothetical UL11 protein [Chelonid alphaherpesvirus 5]